MPKRAKKRTKRAFRLTKVKIFAIALVVVVSAGILFSVGIIGFELSKKEPHKTVAKQKDEVAQLKKLQKLLSENQKRNYDLGISEIDDFKTSQLHHDKIEADKKVSAKEKHHKGKPRIAIILDDISFPLQVKKIKELGMKITMSFLPSNKIHPDTPKLAQNEKFYMVHLPLEAISYAHAEPDTLHVTDSAVKIDKTISKIKADFPRLKFLNNHTGSLFTSDYKAMSLLYNSLKKHDLIFVDSRTTNKTQAPRLSKEMGIKYIARDVFLDHKNSVEYVKNQIRHAIKIAKKSGLAVAIGHPRDKTLKALELLKDELNKDVELIYLNQI